MEQNRTGVTRRHLIQLAGTGGAALSLGLVSGPRLRAMAQEASPVAEGPGGPPLPEGATVIAQGLLAPRYIAIDEDGNIFVTEAGAGGDEDVMMPSADAATPVADPVSLGSRGTTGQVTMIDAAGTATVLATGLPSYNFEGPVGPAGVVIAGGKLWISVGGAGPATAFLEPLSGENSVHSLDLTTGETALVVDLGAIEKEQNPDPNAIDSDVYGMALGPDGMLYVADAGGNCVYKVDPATGDASVLAVIPGIAIPADQAPEGGNPGRGGANELDPVPTDVVVTDDGTAYVSLLSGGPFPVGAAKVVAIAPDGTVTDAVMGLTMATGLALGPDGRWYVCQLSTNFLGAQPEPGSVVRVLEDGSLETVVGGLLLPNGITFDAEGNLYVTTGTININPPDMPPAGMILRFDGVAPAA